MLRDDYFLQKALELAKPYRGSCAPNPSVGAVLVKDGAIIGEGAHLACGEPHAEVMAIRSASKTRGCTLYVTLEPCNHFGKTPPCTTLIIEKEISSVIYAYKDPNPIVSGKGHERLLNHGLDVRHIPIKEITDFYESYSYWHRTGMPFVTAKIALSLDGKIAGPGGKRVDITGLELKQQTYLLRKSSDAILTTAKTIQHDNPELKAFTQSKKLYILDRTCSLSPSFKIWQNSAPITVFYSSGTPCKDLTRVRFVQMRDENGKLALSDILTYIGKDGIHDLFVEAGGYLLESLLEKKAVNSLYLDKAAKWLGEEAQPAFREIYFDDFTDKEWHQFGEDALCKMSSIRK